MSNLLTLNNRENAFSTDYSVDPQLFITLHPFTSGREMDALVSLVFSNHARFCSTQHAGLALTERLLQKLHRVALVVAAQTWRR